MPTTLFNLNGVTVIAWDGNITIDNANPPDDFTLAAYLLKDTPEIRKTALKVANKWAIENAQRQD